MMIGLAVNCLICAMVGPYRLAKVSGPVVGK